MTQNFSPDSPASSASDEVEVGRSPFLAVLGLLSLVVAGWGLVGGPMLGDTHLIPWVLLAVGLAVGVGLVASGVRRQR